MTLWLIVLAGGALVLTTVLKLAVVYRNRRIDQKRADQRLPSKHVLPTAGDYSTNGDEQKASSVTSGSGADLSTGLALAELGNAFSASQFQLPEPPPANSPSVGQIATEHQPEDGHPAPEKEHQIDAARRAQEKQRPQEAKPTAGDQGTFRVTEDHGSREREAPDAEKGDASKARPDAPRGVRLFKRPEGQYLDVRVAEMSARRQRIVPADPEGGSKNPHSIRARRRPSRREGADNVDCSVFAPAEISWAGGVMLQAFLHAPERAERVRALAKEFDPEAGRRGFTTLDLELERGARVALHLEIKGFNIEEPVQTLIWRGYTCSAQFFVTAPAGVGSRAFLGRIRASIEGVPIGNIGFKIVVSEDGKGRPHNCVSISNAVLRFRKAFASYAAADRQEVLKRIQGLSAVGVEVFQDVLHLDPGARWEKELYRAIDESELFLLFWSTAASRSEWVLKEVRYALSRKCDNEEAPPDIVPVIIEGPPPVSPPPELAHLHFDDHRIYLISA